MRSLVLLSFFLLSTLAVKGQQDTTRVRQNTIKLNLMSSFIYSNSFALSYERVVKPNQSWGIMAGYVQFPTLGNLGSNVTVKDNVNHTGYVVGGEYRFYLKKENKYRAPHGVYIGPYSNFYHFSNDRTLTYTSSSGVTSQAVLNSDLNVLNIGVQLGYQFVIKDRWTIDMIFIGPSVSQYRMKLQLDGNLDPSEENDLANEFLGALADKFPLVKELVGKEPVNLHGTSNKWASGFRYQVNVGYRFRYGKKK